MEKVHLVVLSFYYEGSQVLHVCKTYDGAMTKIAEKVVAEGGWTQRGNLKIWNKDDMALKIQEQELES